MNGAKQSSLYLWSFIALFGSVALVMSLKETILLVVVCLSCAIFVVVISEKRKESTAGVERLIRLSQWLETALSFRLIRVTMRLLLLPLVLLQKLGCCLFNQRYQYHFDDIMLRPDDKLTEAFHTAVIIFPYAVVATVGFVFLLIGQKL
jgi:hypothetical protein